MKVKKGGGKEIKMKAEVSEIKNKKQQENQWKKGLSFSKEQLNVQTSRMTNGGGENEGYDWQNEPEWRDEPCRNPQVSKEILWTTLCT